MIESRSLTLASSAMMARRLGPALSMVSIKSAAALAEILVVALAVIGGVVDDRPGLEALVDHELRRRLVLVDHGAVDAVDLLVIVRVGDVGQHRAPDDGGQSELVEGIDGGHRH